MSFLLFATVYFCAFSFVNVVSSSERTSVYYTCDDNCVVAGLYCVTNDQNAFTQCDEQRQRTLKFCASGTVFHPTVKNCVWPGSSIPKCACSNPIAVDANSLTTTTPRPGGPVVVGSDCLDCMCEVETGCNLNYGCDSQGYCGPYKISNPYYIDCGVDGGGYQKCTQNKTCAEACIQGYMRRYAQNCVGPSRAPVCQDFSRIHDVGINGCNDPASLPYWRQVESCLNGNGPNTGPVSEQCLSCMCKVETGCNLNYGCDSQGYCGPYKISYPYYLDCGVDGGGYQQCTQNKTCAEACIQGYMRRYAQSCVGPNRTPSCQDFARIHDVGINGCNDPASIPYWNQVQSCLNGAQVTTTRPPPPGLVERKCFDCLCQAETGCNSTYGCTPDGYCGPYQISKAYYDDCGVSFAGGHVACAHNKACAETCIQNYVNRYVSQCLNPNGMKDGYAACEDVARLHKGGPIGCFNQKAYVFAGGVDKCFKSVAAAAKLNVILIILVSLNLRYVLY